MVNLGSVFYGTIGAMLTLCVCAAHADVIHEERSLYRNIIINEAVGQRCMSFVVKVRAYNNQTCIFLENRKKMVFDYTKVVTGALLAKPNPDKILIVGLGGGTLPIAFRELLPNAQITSVEIDPAVVKAAKAYFGYQEDKRMNTVIQDARVYIKRALRGDEKWDFIVLDAFNGDYIPEHLMTQEFLQEVRSLLRPGGLVVSNTFSSSRLYDHESVTYAAVFPQLKMLRSSNNSGNRVLLAAQEPFTLPAQNVDLAQWQTRFSPYGIEVSTILTSEKPANWDKSAKVLTDQFVPANLLKH